MQERFMTTAEAAEYCGGLKPNTLEIWRIRGQGPPFVKLGRVVRYRKSDVETWIESQVRHSTSEKGETVA